ncbi:MAG: ABC transporter permease [bacterium]|nr:ABC transporter permease [bacterium]
MFKSPRYRILTDYLGMALVVVALCVFFSVKTERFLQPATFTTIANQSADAILLAVGMTFVLIIAGIDLSVGSVLALCGSILGICLTKWGWPLPLAIAAALATGALCGAINGFVVIRWRIPSFIVTLGMLEIARGGASLITRSQSLYIGERIETVADIGMGDLKLPFFIALAVVVVAQLVLTRTAYGRHMLAVGANEDAARLSGLRTRGITWSVFVISGLMAGLASVFFTARMGTANPNSGAGYELQAIAAVVIGGTSLMGGRGSVVSSFFGVAIIAILAYGLTQMDTGDPAKQIVTGCVIVLAVILDVYRHRLGRRTAS